jgi:hypothetical protein
MMTIKLKFFLVLFYSFLCAFNVHARENRMVHQVGTRLLDGQGRPITLHGVNLGGWLLWEGWIFGEPGLAVTSDAETKFVAGLTQLTSPKSAEHFRNAIYRRFINEEDVKQISKAGFNMVRVPINHRLLTYDSVGWSRLNDLLRWCKKYSVYVILDLHSAPGGQSTCWCADPEGVDASLPPRAGPLWSSQKYQDETVALWRKLAHHFKGNPAVAGYDLLNEPAPPKGKALIDLYKRLIRAVRDVDPDHLIVLEGSNSSTEFSIFEQPPCENMVYSPHIYWWSGGSSGNWKEYESISSAQKRPFLVGEFGESFVYSWIDRSVKKFNKSPAICGWTFWTWKKAHGSTLGLVSLDVPGDWASAMRWMKYGWPPPRPSSATVENGMRDFVNVANEHHAPDSRMLHALHLY